jgi:Tol biopolymer transport system component
LELATRRTRALVKHEPADSAVFLSIDWTPDSRAIAFYGSLRGSRGMWLVPVDGSQPHTINVGTDPIAVWRFNAKTGQVAFATDGSAKLEMWKMEHFLSVPVAAER